MADIASSSSVLPEDDKPVIVRVKRKASHSPLEALWLEINERPLKRPLLDFEKLSISDSSGKVEALKPKKVFVQHVETISSSEDTINFNFLKLFEPKSVDGNESKAKNKELRRTFKTENKPDQLLVKAKQKHEVLSKNARFEQIWRTRKGEKDAMRDDGALHEMCHVYDVVRVDVVDTTIEANEQEDTDFEDHRIMSSYLPLLREFIPSAAAEIESDIHDYVSKQASKDDYVYDLYTVKDDVNTSEEDASNPFPLVQVDDDDEFYDGPITSDNESDDSNAEDNPLNDYPDKETSEDDDEHGGSRTSKSNDESEELDSASASSKSEDLEHQNWSEDADPFYEGYICGHDGGGSDGDGDYYDDDGGGDNDEWKWSYR